MSAILNIAATTTLSEVEPAGPVTNEYWGIFVAFVALSLICLFISLCLFASVWDKHNCHGWVQFSYLLALFFFDSVFIIALCPGLTDGNDRNFLCKTISVLNQYFFVAAKTWLIIISIDLFCTVRRKTVIVTGSRNRKCFSRFMIYSLIGWTFPTVFVIVGVVLNLTYNRENLLVDNISDLWTPVPDYGFQHCRIPTWVVWECFVVGNCGFHFFMFVLITVTILLEKRRITNLANLGKTIGNDRNGNVSGNTGGSISQSPVVMLVKLFIVVGLSWSYIAIQDLSKAGNINTKQSFGWHVFRAIFFLQGVFISMITLFNRRMMSNLAAKYPKLKGAKRILNLNPVPAIRMKLCRKGRKESLQSVVSQKTIDSIIPN